MVTGSAKVARTTTSLVRIFAIRRSVGYPGRLMLVEADRCLSRQQLELSVAAVVMVAWVAWVAWAVAHPMVERVA